MLGSASFMWNLWI